MCGRYTLRRPDLIAAHFDASLQPGFEEFTDLKVRLFNAAPSQMLPVVRINSAGERTVGLVQWGLVPSWTKGKPKTRPINARCETAASSGMFRQALQRRRCLIPADGFYEWQGQAPPKQPYFIHMKHDEMFAFGGCWERWKPGADPVDTFTILTTAPNAVMKPLHDRMPVIVNPNDYERWLDRDVGIEAVSDVLAPSDPEPMEAWPVSSKVNTPKNDSPELIEKQTRAISIRS